MLTVGIGVGGGGGGGGGGHPANNPKVTHTTMALLSHAKIFLGATEFFTTVPPCSLVRGRMGLCPLLLFHNSFHQQMSAIFNGDQ